MYDDFHLHTLAELERRYPAIPWREPEQVRLMGDPTPHYVCRVCIANYGLKGNQITSLPTDIEDVREHIKAEHVD